MRVSPLLKSHRMRMTIRKVRVAPGGFRCPACGHIVSSREVCEIVRGNGKKGRRICFDCGIDYLYNRGNPTGTKTGAVQSKGQRTLLPKKGKDVDSKRRSKGRDGASGMGGVRAPGP